MTKAKTATAPPGHREIVRALETLRDDLRRHDAPPVRLENLKEIIDPGDRAEVREGRPELKGPPAEAEMVKAYCERFGSVLEKMPELWRSIGVEPLEDPSWDIRRAAAFHALLERAPWRTVCESRSDLVPSNDPEEMARHLDALPPTLIDQQRRVPDVRLALAELIDLMLEGISRPKRRSREEAEKRRDEALSAALVQLEKDPAATNKEIAEAIGFSSAEFSRSISKDPIWKRAKASVVAREIPTGNGRAVAQDYVQSSGRRKAIQR